MTEPEVQVEQLTVGHVIGKGGEATVYALPSRPGLLLKRYLKPSTEQGAKLAVMIQKPPTELVFAGRTVIAWPKGRVFSRGSRSDVIGFLMPQVDGTPVSQLYNTKSRLAVKPHFNWRYLAQAARNACHVISGVHAVGHVIGDVNDGGILVDDTAVAALVDCDSFQVRDVTQGRTYRCRVGVGLYTPPELLGSHFGDVDRTMNHDAFGLAILVFQMLMGCHPFSVTTPGDGEQPSIEDAIRRSWYPDSPGSIGFSRACPPIELLPTNIRALFRGAFARGANRPSALEWRDGLDSMLRALIVCSRNSNHIFSAHMGSNCPWCDRISRLNSRDPFPSGEAIKRGEHLRRPAQPSPRRGTPAAVPPSPARRPVAPPPPVPGVAAPARKNTVSPGAPGLAAGQQASPTPQRFALSRALGRIYPPGVATLAAIALWLGICIVLVEPLQLPLNEVIVLYLSGSALAVILYGVALEVGHVTKSRRAQASLSAGPPTAGVKHSAPVGTTAPTGASSRTQTTQPSARTPQQPTAPPPAQPRPFGLPRTTPAQTSTGFPTPVAQTPPPSSGWGGGRFGSRQSTRRFVANKQSSKVHLPSCDWAKKISPSNRRSFDSVADAERAGFVRCRVCRP